MGYRTGKEPSKSDSFLLRICHALDLTPVQLANAIEVNYLEELAPLLKKRNHVDRDDVWWKINDYVSLRLGYMMSIKEELNRAMHRDRARRIVRIKRMQNVIRDRD